MLIIFQINFSLTWIKHQRLFLPKVAFRCQALLSDLDAAKRICGGTSPSLTSYKQVITDYWQKALLFENWSCMDQALEGTTDASTMYGYIQIIPLSSSIEHQRTFCHQRLQHLAQLRIWSCRCGIGKSRWNRIKLVPCVSGEETALWCLLFTRAVSKDLVRGYCADLDKPNFLSARIT